MYKRTIEANKETQPLLTVFKTLFLGFAWLASLIVKSLIILGKLSNLTTYQLPVGTYTRI